MAKSNTGTYTLKVLRAFVWCMRQHPGFTKQEFYNALSEWRTEGESPRFLNFLVKGGYLIRAELNGKYLYIPQPEHRIPNYKARTTKARPEARKKCHTSECLKGHQRDLGVGQPKRKIK